MLGAEYSVVHVLGEHLQVVWGALVALIVVVPVSTPVTLPLLPAELSMVATAGLDDDHVTDVVMSFTLPSVKVPSARY